MDPSEVRCAYCGDPMSEWDHLLPLVKDQKPTGYISEIGNLVPACGKCNQSKGNKPWRDWMLGASPRSPKSRGIRDLEARVRRLEVYEQWPLPEPMNFESIVGSALWQEHWKNWKGILEAMRKSQELAITIRDKVAATT